MSHTSEISDAPFTDAECLRQAVESLAKRGTNCSLAKDTRPRMWYQDQFTKEYGETADYTLQLPDCRFDFGFVRKCKNLVPVFDPHGEYIAHLLGNKKFDGFDRAKAGDHIRALTAEYLYFVQLKAVKKAGYTVSSIKRNDKGEIKLRVTC